jgi:hypothetical protein
MPATEHKIRAATATRLDLRWTRSGRTLSVLRPCRARPGPGHQGIEHSLLLSGAAIAARWARHPRVERAAR